MGARRLMSRLLVLLGVVTGVLVFASVPALALAPTVVGESFSNVGSASAIVSAQVNANGLLTSYDFEYGTSAAYGSTTPLVSLGAGSSDAGGVAQLSGLQPDTAYHFRVVATSESGVVQGGDVTFNTLPVGILGLPDGRGYEMVSPVVNYNGNVYEDQHNSNFSEGIFTTVPFQASVSGDAVAYAGDPSLEGNGKIGHGEGNEFVARRAPAGGWAARDITPAGVNNANYQAFSSDLSLGFVSVSQRPLSVGAPSGDVLYAYATSDGSYHSFFTIAPANGRFLESFNVQDNGNGGLAYAGASSDLGHLLFEANNALTTNAIDGGAEQNNLYDSTAGQLHLVNVLPNGVSEANATFGATGLNYRRLPPDFSHVISADGSRIFWTDLNTGVLYVRENDTQPQSPLGPKGECTVPADACTVQVDTSQGPDTGGGGRFWTASDGSKVFFTTCKRLTADSTAVSAGGCVHEEQGEVVLRGNDLYEYDVNGAHLVDLTVDGQAGDGLGADVKGVVGTSEDGSYVYFVANGVLGSGAVHQNCEQNKPSEEEGIGCNLYVRHEGKTTFIATLSGRDNSGIVPYGPHFLNESTGDWVPGLAGRTAEVTPDGRHLVFMSQQSLTGYANRGFEEVYVYDASTGHLSCVSCQPSGASPVTNSDSSGGYVPPSWNETFMHHWISDDGTRAFFATAEQLVPQDTNGLLDVYEWEQNGAGSCRRAGGCVYLLSGGTSADISAFADASASGNDVFIVTRAQLVPQDGNENFDLYDVRIGGPQPPSPPACTGTGCQGVPPAPPIFATPSSVTFSGVGNFPGVQPAVKPRAKPTKCRKGHRKKRGKCVRKARKSGQRSKRGRK
jgi:hypothetical protein